ncbi:armadillo-type protein, partial [Polychytrium aggregatum]|uniref:armadillo-type protein n=1 Tax=Polychytrium aggregatum TaxID=110093 RepID=UPI0022FDF8CB
FLREESHVHSRLTCACHCPPHILQFISFQDRIKNIKLNIAHRVAQLHDEPEDGDSFFNEGLLKWRDTNCTTHFTQFCRAVSPLCQSLPQLLYHKEAIVKHIESYMTIEHELALEPLLNLVTLIARDLQDEFYPYFPRVFLCMRAIIKSNPGAAIYEMAFQSMAYLFKYLSAELIRDVDATYDLVLPLLGDSKYFVRNFTAEAYGFLLRKVTGDRADRIFHNMISSLEESQSQDLCDGLAVTFFESIKHVNHHLHSKAKLTLARLLAAVFKQTDENDIAFEMAVKVFAMSAHHANSATLSEVFDLAIESVEQQQSDFDIASASPEKLVTFGKSHAVLSTLVGLRKGTRVTDLKRLFRLFEQSLRLVAASASDSYCATEVIKGYATLVSISPFDDVLVLGHNGIKIVFELKSRIYTLLFCEQLQLMNWEHYGRFIVPKLLEFWKTRWDQNIALGVLAVSRIFESGFEDYIPMLPAALKSPSGFVKLAVTGGKGPKGTHGIRLDDLFKLLNALPARALFMADATDNKASLVSASIVCLQYLDIDFDVVFGALVLRLRELVGVAQKLPKISAASLAFSIIGQLLSAITVRCRKSGQVAQLAGLWDLVVHDLISALGRHSVILEEVTKFCEALRYSGKHGECFTAEKLKRVFPVLKPQIGSFDNNTRKHALAILLLFDQLPLVYSSESDHSGTCPILQYCYDIECLENSIQSLREKTMLLRKIDSLVTSKTLPALYIDVPVRYFLALLSVNFAPLWPSVSQSLANAASADHKTFWPIYFERFLEAKEQSLHPTDKRGIESQSASEGGYKAIKDTYLRCHHLDLVKSSNASACEVYRDHAVERLLMRHGWIGHDASANDNLGRAATIATIVTIARDLWADIHPALRLDLPQPALNRFDYVNYFQLTIRTLGLCPQVVQQESKSLVPLIINILRKPADEDTEIPGEMADAQTQLSRSASPMQIRNTIVELLKMFAQIRRPAKLHLASELYQIYLDYLIKGDAKLQQLALDCLFTFNDSGVIAYKEQLLGLADDQKFRDFLSTWDVEQMHAQITVDKLPPLIEILIRVLYGKVISRRGRHSSKHSHRTRRLAVFAFLTSLSDSERLRFVDVMLTPFSDIFGQPAAPDNTMQLFPISALQSPDSLNKQIGFLRSLEELIKQFRTLVSPFIDKLMRATICMAYHAECTLSSSKALADLGAGGAQSDGDDNSENADEGVDGDTDGQSSLAQLRSIRQLAIRRLTQIFDMDLDVNYGSFMPAIFSSIIDPRIDTLARENTQGPSSLVELVVTWSKHRRTIPFLVRYNPLLLTRALALLSAKKVHTWVIASVTSIIESLLECSTEHPEDLVMDTIVRPHLSVILEKLGYALVHHIMASSGPVQLVGDNVPTRIIRVLAKLSNFAQSTEQIESIVDLLVPFLKRPGKFVPEIIKTEIITILANFLPHLPTVQSQTPSSTKYYGIASQLFSITHTRECRTQAVALFARFAELEPELAVVAELVQGLNAFSTRRMDEPDFDRRFDAFNKVSRELHPDLVPVQWLPLLHNFVHHVQDPTEYSIRSNAAFCIVKFLENAAAQQDLQAEYSEAFMSQVVHVVFPALKRGLRINAEPVRQEFVGVLGSLVRLFPSAPNFKDMVVLLHGDDDEANFFSNINHLQIHRRAKALRRLAGVIQEGRIQPANVSNVFVPMIKHYIFASEQTSEQTLLNEAISTVGSCAGALPWGSYYSLLRQFTMALPKLPTLEKVLIRTIIAILEKFHFLMALAPVAEPDHIDGQPKSDHDNEAVGAEHDDEEAEHAEAEAEPVVDASASSQSQEALAIKVHNILLEKIIPDLYKLLTKDDDDTLSSRVPIALAIARLLKQLPAASLDLQLPKLLTTMCNLLRSKRQDIRDTTRETLVKIALHMGPKYLLFLVKELDRALQRGYQLHVLGYTIHHLLMGICPMLSTGDLDICTGLLIKIMVNDIFGETGKEREVEELRGKMREIKATKSFDSFELLAGIISFEHIGAALLPLKELMLETNNSKVTKKIEEVLRRMALGLIKNPDLTPKNLMIFIHGLINEILPLSRLDQQKKEAASEAEKTFLVELGRTNNAQPLKYFQANAFMFIEFGLSLLMSALKQEKISTRDPDHLAMLDPMLTVLGRSLYSQHASVIILALRILCILFKAPLASSKEVTSAVQKRLFEIIAKATTTNSELVQSTFRLLVVIIRDCSASDVTQKQLVTIITMIQPDIEEPERQVTTFSLIRAILTRKYVVKEIYDLMDTVATVMITSQSGQVRELCRGVYLQFLLDYPHGPTRLEKQIRFLVKNLQYQYESGRESVMEMLHLVIVKFLDEVLYEYSEMVFLALVMSMVNDESAKCREMAAALLVSLLKRVGVAKGEKLMTMVNKWFDQPEQLHLQRTAAQLSGLFVEGYQQSASRWLPQLLKHLQALLATVIDEVEASQEDDEFDQDEKPQRWEIGYYALSTFSRIVQVFPASATQKSTEPIWIQLRTLLLYPHQWIRSLSDKILGALFSILDADGQDEGRHILLKSQQDTFQLAIQLHRQLGSSFLTAECGTQLVKNLFFVGKQLYNNDEGDDDDHDRASTSAGALQQSRAPNQRHNSSENSRSPLLTLFKKLSYIARMDGMRRASNPVTKTSIFQWFAAMATFIPPTRLKPFLHAMLTILYRVSVDDTAKGKDAEDHKLLASEVMDLLQKKAGHEMYLDAYNSVHFHVQNVRRDRKTKRAVQTIVDPEAMAKRRIQKNEMKRANRKRKAEVMASHRVR